MPFFMRFSFLRAGPTTSPMEKQGGTMLRYTRREFTRKFYICDRKKCENCTPDCRHTLDIEHAVYPDYDNFSPEESGLWQREKKCTP